MRDVLNGMSLHLVTIRAIDRSENGQLVFSLGIYCTKLHTTYDLLVGATSEGIGGSAWIYKRINVKSENIWLQGFDRAWKIETLYDKLLDYIIKLFKM